MNYYPQYGNQQIPNYYQQPQYQYQMPYQQPVSQINGKVVDSEDIVRVQEIPMGSFGIFPKADQSKIFLKTWCADGTTKITSYVPVVEEVPEVKDPYSETLSSIQKQISDLGKKIDGMKSTSSPARKKREVVEDDDE